MSRLSTKLIALFHKGQRGMTGLETAITDNSAIYVFNLKNAIAGEPIDVTSCDGPSNAKNKCVISFATKNDYCSNVNWTDCPVYFMPASP